mgnify:FL=1
MVELIKNLKIASRDIVDTSHVRAIEVFIEALSGVRHQLVHNTRTHTTQVEEKFLDRPVIFDSYFVTDQSTYYSSLKKNY